VGLKPVYLIHSHLITPLGVGILENMEAIRAGKSGLSYDEQERFFKPDFPLGIIPDSYFDFKSGAGLTRFDALIEKALKQCISSFDCPYDSSQTLFILSTTKGNVESLANGGDLQESMLHFSAARIQAITGNPNQVITISNACISGISAFIMARRYLQSGQYKQAVIIGCDVLSQFVISGFHSFHALSKEICKPFDLDRNGINLGEACAISILSTEQVSPIQVGQGFISNDSNHISGPSKTGEELAWCIQQTLRQQHLGANDIGFISAHGTATAYNDEMESKAFDICGLHHNPVFSMKGYFGHTLGAAGVLELALSAEFLNQDFIPASFGFTQNGVSGNIQVNKVHKNQTMQNILKTGSGFGGCNAAIILFQCELVDRPIHTPHERDLYR
jgi:3-oxoacyl-[acyl-carrier-protein] synthase-1